MPIALTNNIALAQPISGSVDLPDTTIELDFGAEKDAAISNRIRAALAALDGYEAVEVEVDAGVVSLSGSAVDEAAVLRLEQIVRRIDGVVAVNDRVAASTDLAERLAPIRGRFVNRLWQTVSYLPLLTVAVVVFILVYLLGAAIGRITSVWRSLAPNAFIASIYAQLVRLVFAILGIVAALDILGATALLGSILGAAGIIGLAIGFAVRDTVENFIASVMLSIRQPFSPFDTIGIDGDVGKVVRLTSRATILISPEGNLVRVPNATVFKSRLVNFSRNPERRFSFSLDVDPSAELAGLREALQAKLAALPFVLSEPAPLVWLQEDEGDRVRLGFAGWIDLRQTNWDLSRGEAIRILRAEVAARKATVPPPLSRVITVNNGRDAEAAQHLAATSDLDEATLPELSNREDQDLERLVEAERQVPQTHDLLATEAPKE